MSATRSLSPLDRLLDSAQNALSTVAGSPRAERANPGDDTPDVVLDDAVLGKPESDEQAFAMLRALSGASSVMSSNAGRPGM